MAAHGGDYINGTDPYATPGGDDAYLSSLLSYSVSQLNKEPANLLEARTRAAAARKETAQKRYASFIAASELFAFSARFQQKKLGRFLVRFNNTLPPVHDLHKRATPRDGVECRTCRATRQRACVFVFHTRWKTRVQMRPNRVRGTNPRFPIETRTRLFFVIPERPRAPRGHPWRSKVVFKYDFHATTSTDHNHHSSNDSLRRLPGAVHRAFAVRHSRGVR
jgi:hypothetical protein